MKEDKYIELLIRRLEKSGVWKWTCQLKIISNLFAFQHEFNEMEENFTVFVILTKIKQPKTMKMHRNTREKFNELNLIYFSGKRTPARVPRVSKLIAECKTHQISIFVACAVVEI